MNIKEIKKEDVEMKDSNATLTIDEIIKKDLGYDSNLYKDEADQHRLNRLPQIEKEKELEIRRQKREDLFKQYEFIKKQQLKNNPNLKNNLNQNSISGEFNTKKKIVCSSESQSSESSSSSSSSSSEESDRKKRMNNIQIKKANISDSFVPNSKDLQIILTTRTFIGENIESTYLKELTENSIVRFAAQNDKYVIGIIKDIVTVEKSDKELTGGKYQFLFQKSTGMTDKMTGKQVMKPHTISTDKEFLIVYQCEPNLKLDQESQIIPKQKRVKFSYISNGRIQELELQNFLKNFHYISSKDSLQQKNQFQYKSLNEIQKIADYRKQIIQGNLSQFQMEVLIKRQLWQKIKQKKIDQINFPKEKAKLSERIYEIENQLSKNFNFQIKQPIIKGKINKIKQKSPEIIILEKRKQEFENILKDLEILEEEIMIQKNEYLMKQEYELNENIKSEQKDIEMVTEDKEILFGQLRDINQMIFLGKNIDNQKVFESDSLMVYKQFDVQQNQELSDIKQSVIQKLRSVQNKESLSSQKQNIDYQNQHYFRPILTGGITLQKQTIQF